MGGYGSGRHASRYWTAEDARAISIVSLARWGSLRAGAWLVSSVRWFDSDKPDVTTSTVSVETNATPTGGGPFYRIRYGIPGAAPSVCVAGPLLPAVSPSGGMLWYFGCTYCGRRARVLYLPPGAREFACRRCHRLRYRSQRETSPDRMLRRAQKLRLRLRRAKHGSRVLRPKWMRRRTYRRILQEAEDLENVSLALAFARILPEHPLSAEIRAARAAQR